MDFKRPQNILNGLISKINLGPAKIQMKIHLEEKDQNQLSKKFCLFIHGLMDDQDAWLRNEGVKFGELIEKDFGFTPIYLRYNTGKHISENGHELSQLLEDFLNNNDVKNMIIIAHSMGGLVVRSACHYSVKTKWIDKVSRIFYLGTPHQGAPLEKFGNLATNILKILPYPFTNFSKNIINLRSSGIKDLRYGYLVDEDWKGKNPDALLSEKKKKVPLHPNISHYAIASSIVKNPKHLLGKFVGDSMVLTASAFGQSRNKSLELYFYPNHLVKMEGLSHIGLTYSLEVYQVISDWMREPPLDGSCE